MLKKKVNLRLREDTNSIMSDISNKAGISESGLTRFAVYEFLKKFKSNYAYSKHVIDNSKTIVKIIDNLPATEKDQKGINNTINEYLESTELNYIYRMDN